MVVRVFAVLAAVFLVAAAGFALLMPMGMRLSDGVAQLDRTALDWAQAHSASWLWAYVEVPVLLRPIWLLPASLGMICAGIAGSSNLTKSTNTRHRRS